MLGGLVVNNGIVMLDTFGRLERRGLSIRESVVTGAVVRLRPILMTAATTLFGLAPMMIGVPRAPSSSDPSRSRWAAAGFSRPPC